MLSGVRAEVASYFLEWLFDLALWNVQRANTFTYPAQVLQGDGSQTCLSEESRERVRNEVKDATQRLL